MKHEKDFIRDDCGALSFSVRLHKIRTLHRGGDKKLPAEHTGKYQEGQYQSRDVPGAGPVRLGVSGFDKVP